MGKTKSRICVVAAMPRHVREQCGAVESVSRKPESPTRASPRGECGSLARERDPGKFREVATGGTATLSGSNRPHG